MSPSSFGSCPVPNSAARRTTCGGAHLDVAVLAGVQVEHEVDQRALSRAPRAGEEREAASRAIFAARVEVEQPSGSAISQ